MISNFKLIRDPFNKALNKRKIVWIKCGIKEKEYICNLINLKNCNFIYSAKNNIKPYGFYKININKYNKYFLKIISRENFRKENENLKLENWLYKKKINVSFLEINEKKILINNKFVILISSFITECDYKYKNKKIKYSKLGESVAKLHNSLRLYPKRKLYRTNTLKFNIKLKKKLVEIKKNLSSLNKKQKEIFKNETNLNLIFNNGQILHGDLNQDNVLFTKKGIHFIDFEDSIRSFLNPISEIVFIIERFTTFESEKKTFEISKLFLKHYLKNIKFKVRKFNITDYLKILSVRSLLILKINKSKNMKEIKKFENLYFRAIKYEKNYLKIINDLYE